MTGLWLISYIVLWILFLIVAFVLLSVLRNLGVIYDSISSRSNESAPTKLISGDRLPDVKLTTLSGDNMSISKLGGVKKAISIISPTCEPCQELLRRITAFDWQLDPKDPTVQQVAVISIGDTEATIELIHKIGLRQDIPVFIDSEHRIYHDWGVSTTPTTIIVDDQLNVVRHVIGLGGETVRQALTGANA